VFTETDIQIIKTPGWHNNLMPLPRRRRRDALLDGRGHHRRCEGPAAGIDTRGDQLVRARDLPGRPPGTTTSTSHIVPSPRPPP